MSDDIPDDVKAEFLALADVLAESVLDDEGEVDETRLGVLAATTITMLFHMLGEEHLRFAVERVCQLNGPEIPPTNAPGGSS